MPPNNAYPLQMPRRRFGGRIFKRVYYRSDALGPIGWLVRWHRRGRVSNELADFAKKLYYVFDHAEMWLSTHLEGEPEERILVSHPYRFDDEMRATLIEAASERFELAWSAIPPAATVPPATLPDVATSSWYSRDAWMITVHRRGFFALPADSEVPWRKTQGARKDLLRRPLRTGEVEVDVLAEQAETQRKRDAARWKRTKPTITLADVLEGRVKPVPAPKPSTNPYRPVTLHDAITNPQEATQRARRIAARAARR